MKVARSKPSMAWTAKRFWICVLVIAAVMFGFRVAQIGHGLPDIQVPDESSDLSTTPRLLLGDLPPTNARYSRTLISNLELFGFGTIYVANVARTGNLSFSAFRDLFFAERATFQFVSRLIVVLISVFALIALADLLRRTVSPLAGIIAVLLMCFFYFWDLQTLYAVPDAVVASAVLFFLWAVIRLLEKDTRVSYILAGWAYAFVMLSKISAAPIGLALIIVHFMLVWNQGKTQHFFRRFFWNDKVLFCALTIIIGNVVMNPFGFVRPNDFITEINGLFSFAFNSSSVVSYSLAERIGLLLTRTQILFTTYAGWPLTVAFIVGLVAVFVRRQKVPIIILVSSLPVWLVIGIQTGAYFDARPFYWMPIIPTIIIFSAIGLEWIVQLASIQQRLVYAGALVLVAAVVLNEAVSSVQLAIMMNREYAPIQAQDYIYANWPKDAAIMMGSNVSGSVPLDRDEQSIQRARQLGAPELQSWSWWLRQPSEVRQHEYNIYGPELKNTFKSYDDVRDLILKENIRYIVYADYCSNTENRLDATSPWEFPPLNAQLRSALRPIKVFSPFENTDQCLQPINDRTSLLNRSEIPFFYRNGPLIRLYEVDKAALEAQKQMTF